MSRPQATKERFTTETQRTQRTLGEEHVRTLRVPSLRSLCLCVSVVNVLLVLSLTACRSGPPPTPPAQAAARLQAGAGNYKDVVVVDAQCSSFANKDDQIVCIANKGKDPVKISNWLIRNTIGRTYYFPAGTVIDGGKTLKVHTGAGTNSATDLYWNYEFKPVFDSKDQITLVDDSATDVAKFTTP
jgi:lamin tail-like protein